MADLQFVDQHNMLACLERSDENAEFHQIVDFLTTSSIHYALTQIHATVDGKTVVISESSVRSDLYFNDEDGITCLSNDEIFVNLALMRNLDSTSKKFLMYPRFLQLFLNNQIALAEPFNDIYVTPIHTKKVFTNMKRQNKDFSGRITSLFASMLVPQVVEGEGSGKPFEPQLPSSTAPPSQVTTVTTQHQKTHKSRQAKEGEDDRVVRASTTASSLEAEQESDAHTRFETASKKSHDPPLSEGNTSRSGEDSMEHQVDLIDFVPPTPHDSPLSGGHTPRSDEVRPNFNELINLCTQLSNRVLALENSKTTQDLVIQKLKKRVKRLEKALRVRTSGMKLFKIGISKIKGLDKENVSKQGRKSDKTKPMFNDSDFDVLDDAMENVKGGSTAEQITTARDTFNTASINVSVAGPSHVSIVGPSNVSVAGPSTSTARDIFEDEMTTIVDTLMAISSARPRTTSVVICNVEEEPRRATPVPTVQSQDKAQFEKEQRIARGKVAEQETKDVALIEQMEDIQARIDADELLAERLQQKEREQFTVDEQARMLVDLIAERKKFFAAQRSKSFEEIQKLYKKEQQWINDFVPMSDDSGKKDDSSSKQVESSKKRPRAEHDEESVKKQKLEDEAEREELRACLDIVPGDDIAMDFESLAIKYPIIDWKTHILTKNMMYYQIIIADGSSKNYKIFSRMLDDFDRQDVIDLYRLVKERYETTSPEGYDLLLFRDLKTLFEPSKEDEIWKNQQDYNLISWRLFDSCRVHVLLMDTRISIHMMVENTYPLT
ncbi:hypothetical protein Tco_0486511 [Tanacetum coccineum]